jgi:hypothetical protein
MKNSIFTIISIFWKYFLSINLKKSRKNGKKSGKTKKKKLEKEDGSNSTMPKK